MEMHSSHYTYRHLKVLSQLSPEPVWLCSSFISSGGAFFFFFTFYTSPLILWYLFSQACDLLYKLPHAL